MQYIKIDLEKNAKYPTKAHRHDAGFDLYNYCLWEKDYEKYIATFRTGVHIYLPENYCALVVSKSGLHRRRGILTDGLIDSNYTGEIMVTLNFPYAYQIDEIQEGDKIAQLLILKLPTIELVDNNLFPYQTEFIEEMRGDNGFGSTGR